MRIHTSTDVTSVDVYVAARTAGAYAETLTEHGSRSHGHAFEVKLTGTSNRRPNGGNRGAGDDYAATWDQWGLVLAAIFAVDPDARCWAYKDAQDFHRTTGDRFLSVPVDMHGDHTFRFDGTPHESACTKCSAVQRWSA